MQEQESQLSFETNETIFSVTQVTERVSGALQDAFPLPVWVRGEVSNFRGRNQKGHLYFSVKDENALLPCVFFARKNAELEIDLADGLEVMVLGVINVYAPHGRYQLVIERLLPGGLGQLYLKFEQLKKKLQSEGLFDEARKREIPRFPQAIGIVTSPTGAVIRDMLKILNRRYPRLQVVIAPALMQGEGSKESIVRAIGKLQQLTLPKIDTIVLARGGGSIEDLWAFNEEVVARAIASSKIPVISAIGHETDFTISDFIADARAATPTHAAELVAPDRLEMLSELKRLTEKMFTTLTQEITVYQQTLKRCSSSPALRFPEKIVVDARQTLDRLQESADHRLERLLKNKHLAWLAPAERLKSLSPLKVLERGFALAETPSGELVREAGSQKSGNKLAVRLWRGSLKCKVEEVAS